MVGFGVGVGSGVGVAERKYGLLIFEHQLKSFGNQALLC